MRKVFIAGFIGAWVILTWSAPVHSQDEKKPSAEKQVNPAIAVDSNQYVIGPEDVLNIYVWKEETLSRTVPVRMDGKIS